MYGLRLLAKNFLPLSTLFLHLFSAIIPAVKLFGIFSGEFLFGLRFFAVILILMLRTAILTSLHCIHLQFVHLFAIFWRRHLESEKYNSFSLEETFFDILIADTSMTLKTAFLIPGLHFSAQNDVRVGLQWEDFLGKCSSKLIRLFGLHWASKGGKMV